MVVDPLLVCAATALFAYAGLSLASRLRPRRQKDGLVPPLAECVADRHEGLLGRPAAWNGRVLPTAFLSWCDRMLKDAGFRVRKAVDFLVLLEAGAIAFALLGALAFPDHPLAGAFSGLALGPAVGFTWLQSAARNRRQQLLVDLPWAMDMLTMCVEAGADPPRALAKTAETLDVGPLKDEFALLRAELELGRSWRQALEGLAGRIDLPPVRSLVHVLIQSSDLGANVAAALRTEAEQLRFHRTQQLEEEAAKASTQILIPTIVFILPAVLIVVLGPTFLKFLQQKGG